MFINLNSKLKGSIDASRHRWRIRQAISKTLYTVHGGQRINHKSYVAHNLASDFNSHHELEWVIARIVFFLQSKINSYVGSHAVQYCINKYFNSRLPVSHILVNPDHFHQECARRELKCCHINLYPRLASSRLAGGKAPLDPKK